MKTKTKGRNKVGPDDLRRAPPVKRLMAQLASFRKALDDRRATFASWGESLPEGSDSQKFIRDGLKAFVKLLDSFGAVIGTLARMQEAGFTPPRKCYTAATAPGDHIAILECHHGTYSDVIPVALMGDLEVVQRYPGKSAGGKGGGLTAQASDGTRLKVAAAHVVRLTS